MKRRDDRDEEVKPIARQIEQLARAPLYAPRGYRTGDYGNHTERQLLFRLSVVASAGPCAHATISRRDELACAQVPAPSGNSICCTTRK